MKYPTIVLSALGLAFAGLVHAQSLRDLPVVFDHYQVMPDVKLVPENQAPASQKIGEMQGQVAVGNPQTSSNVVRPGTVLRNKNSGQIAVATGELAVITQPDQNIYELAKAHGLTVARSVPQIHMYVLTADKNQNLLDVRKSLQGDNGVKSVKLDIKENRQQPM